MTAARLSPAASLLRNSKLFALPPTVALPPSRPTAEPVGSSDTATTVYPIKAALETPQSSLKAGDWGLKRNLPLKSTTKTSTPSIRLSKDIDTEHHIADFDSAADHVVTLNKWANINPQIVNTPRWGSHKSADRRVFSVFHPDLDNTTSSSSKRRESIVTVSNAQKVPEHLQQALQQLRADQQASVQAGSTPVPPPRPELQTAPKKIRRWRYDGPWLAGMSNLEFDGFLKEVTTKSGTGKFDEFLLSRNKAMDDQSTSSWTAQRLHDIKKELRIDRKAFASTIAEFLDLPDGPERPSMIFKATVGGDWTYSRDTAATKHYKEVGPPRTHPSAGFSYVRSSQHASNDPRIGPSHRANALPARLLKDSSQPDASGRRQMQQSIGVAGIVAREENYGTRQIMSSESWRPTPGGPRLVVKLLETTVQQDGGIEVGVVRDRTYQLDEKNVPYNRQERDEELRAQRRMPETPNRLQQLDQQSGIRPYRKNEPMKDGLDEEASDIVAALSASLRRGSE